MKSIPAVLCFLLAVGAYAGSPPQEDPFDPALIRWDPGTIQIWNPPEGSNPGYWSLTLDHRTIVQADIPSLSPLEIQQAVKVLTDRTYPIEFVLDHLEQFRALVRVDPRD